MYSEGLANIEIHLDIIKRLIPLAKEHFGIDVPVIPIKMTNAMCAAGLFVHVNKVGKEYRFSNHHATHEPDFFKDTVVHEFTHHLQLLKDGHSDHGPHFMAYNAILGGAVTKCHNYTLGATIICSECANVHELSKRKLHNMLKKGFEHYICSKCKLPLNGSRYEGD